MDASHCKKNIESLTGIIRRLAKYLCKNFKHSIISVIILLVTAGIYFFFVKSLLKQALCNASVLLSDYTLCEMEANQNTDQSIFIAIATAVVLFIGFHLTYSAVRNYVLPFKGKQRNADYLIEQMSSNDRRLPLVSIEQQIVRIAGKDADEKTKADIQNRTISIIDPIKSFIVDDEKTLILDGKWGSGKTSYTLIAINEASKEKSFEETDYRFIYESAFKYVSNFNEFKSDILKAIQIILSEQNIFAPNAIHELINNISNSSFYIPLMTLSGSITTTDNIEKLNTKYAKRQKRNPRPFQIILVIDDIDRLLGEDIIQTLSFLSVVRRIKFIKILLPIDRNIVIRQLKNAKVIEPETFIKKHLPEQSEINIPTTFDLFKDIYSSKIRKAFSQNLSAEQIQPILENICLKIFSNKLNENMEAVSIGDLGDWPNITAGYPKELTNNNEYNSKYILEASRAMYNNATEGNRQYIYHLAGVSNEFEALIYKLKYKDKRNPLGDGSNPLRLDIETYNDCFKPWIMLFAQNRWSQVGATMRIIDDIFERLQNKLEKDAINSSIAPNLIFVRAYNALFPRWPIVDENLNK